MKIWISSDSEWQSQIGRIIGHYSDNEAKLLDLSYGKEIDSVAIIVVCRYRELGFKRRTLFRRKMREFYTDIMLDLPTIMPLSMKEKMSYVSRELHDQLSEQLNKRKFKDFDHIRFLADLREWLNGIEERYDGHTTGAWHY